MIPFVKLEEFEILGILKKKLESPNFKKVSINTINAMITKEIHNNREKIIRNLLRLNPENNKTIYRILHVFFHIVYRNFPSSLC